jgi:lysophospholipase L1-like esterase
VSTFSRRRLGIACASALAVALVGLAAPAIATQPSRTNHEARNDSQRHWVSAWTASMQGPGTLGLSGIETVSGSLQQRLLHAVVPPPQRFSDQTLRQVLYVHRGGDSIRIRLSNEFGTAATRFPRVTLGIRRGPEGAKVRPGTLRTLTFGGARSVRIAHGKTRLSDPIQLRVSAFDHLIVSIHVPQGSGAATAHGNSLQTFFTAAGDQTRETSDTGFTERGLPDGGGTNLATHVASTASTAVYYVEQVQVRSSRDARTLVTFGDSITDGFLSSVNTDSRYPDVLARRLAASSSTDCLSVTSQAISGGRVTGPGIGPSGLARFRHEVLEQPNVAGVIFLQGINDLGTALLQDTPKTAEDLIKAYTKLATMARDADVSMWIGTLTPSGNLARPAPYGTYSTPIANAERAEVNAWLRGPGGRLFAGVIDFDKTIRDPLVPDWISTLAYDSGDNLHPNDAGYSAMARSIPLAPLAALCD